MSDLSFVEGVRLFNAGRYFEAHEVWELIWHAAEGTQRERLQGLIQAAVALHHECRGNHAGAVTLLGKVKARLSGGFPEGITGNPLLFLKELERFINEAPPAGEGRRAPRISVRP